MLKLFYRYFGTIYITSFSLMLVFCVFFRHGVEHLRYVLTVLTLFFFITNKKYLLKILTSSAFLSIFSFLIIALASLMHNSSPLSRIDEIVNWILIFIFGYVATLFTSDNNTKFIYIIPTTLILAIIVFPAISNDGLSHLNIMSKTRLTLYFQQKANHLGLICGIFSFATCYLGAQKKGAVKLILFLLSLICAFFLFRTGSRGSFLGLAVTLSGWMIWRAKKTGKKNIFISFLLTLSLIVAILFSSPLANNRAVSYITKGISHDRSVLQRFFIWNVAYTNFIEQPFLGKGFDSFSDQYKDEIHKYNIDDLYKSRFPYTIASTNNAHNFFLHFLSETGIFGLIAMLSFWITIILKGLKSENSISAPVSGMFIISFIAFQMNMSMYGLQISTILFAFAGLSACPSSNNIICTHSPSKLEITANKHNSYDNNVNRSKL